jgi:hypothetical protein
VVTPAVCRMRLVNGLSRAMASVCGSAPE